jgi:DNA repair exonuclease SbcCD ATPase subunit
MIEFTAINCTGMFSFGKMETIALESRGLVFLSGVNKDRGGSNGSGKSSFINSIKEICFGKNDTGKSGPNIVNKSKNWKNGCFGALWLIDHDGDFWRIFMLRRWKGDPPSNTITINDSELLKHGGKYVGTDIFLEKWDAGRKIWVDERPTSSGSKTYKDVQSKIINEILRMTYEQFSAYVLLGQKAKSSLVDGTSGDREKIIQAVTNVSQWEAAINVTKSKLAECNTAMEIAVNNLQSYKTMLDSMQEVDSRQQLEISDEISKLNQQISELNSKEIIRKQELEKLLNSGDSDLNQEMQLLIAERRHASERLANFSVSAKCERLIELEHEFIKANAHLSDLNNKYHTAKKLNIGECDRCGQPITNKYLNEQLLNMQRDIDEFTETLEVITLDLKQENDKYEEEIRLEKQEVKDKYEQDIYYLNQSEKKLIERIRHYEEMVNVARDNINKIQLDIQKCKVSIHGYQQQLNTINKQMESLRLIEGKFKLLEDEVKENKSIINHWEWVNRNLKKIKLQEYNNAIDRLNQLISVELQIIWGSEIDVRFVTAQEKASGKGMKQGLELIITEPDKKGVPIELWSGGESKAIIIAIFMAMRKLTRERGCGVNISAIDELDKDLCEVNVDRMVNTFEYMASDSPTCIVISHNSRLLSTMNFNDVWVAEKIKGITNIIEGNIL